LIGNSANHRKNPRLARYLGNHINTGVLTAIYKMKFSVSALLAATTLAGEINPVGGTPDVNEVYIAGITYGGSGCKQGTVSAAFTQDRKTVTLLFDEFIAQTGRGTKPTDARKACQINVDMRYPSGWSYSIMKVDYRGYVGIPAGFSAVQTSTYYFSGQSGQYVAKTSFRGPKYDDYKVTDQFPVEKYDWSPCGSVQRGNIKASVELRGDGSKSALMTVDSIDGKVQQLYGIQWRRC
jgi:hypothetical protein